MEVERVRLGLGEAETVKNLANGDRVRVRRKEGRVVAKNINGTARHEGWHSLAGMLVGIGVLQATDQPGPGYSGATWISEYERRVVAAPEAMGCDGTGQDLRDIEEHGDSVEAAVADARALLAGHQDELAAVATEIQKRGTASGAEMRFAKDRPRVDHVEVQVETARGELRDHTQRLFDNVLDVPIIPIER